MDVELNATNNNNNDSTLINENCNGTNGTIDDNKIKDIFDIEIDIEECFEEFTNITKEIMSFSNLKAIGKETNLTNSNIDIERKEYERISNEQIIDFNNNFEEKCNSISKKLKIIDSSIKSLSEDEDLKKSNEKLMSELREIKFKQQEEMKELDTLITTAKDALNCLDRNSSINKIYEYNIK